MGVAMLRCECAYSAFAVAVDICHSLVTQNVNSIKHVL